MRAGNYRNFSQGENNFEFKKNFVENRKGNKNFVNEKLLFFKTEQKNCFIRKNGLKIVGGNPKCYEALKVAGKK